MDIQSRRLKELIDLSNSEISDLIIDDTKFGDILKDLHPQKINTKFTSNKNKSSTKNDKKFISHEIIEEDLLLEEKAEKEDDLIEQLKNDDILNNQNSNLILKYEEENEPYENKIGDESLLNSALKLCEESKEKNKKTIDDIFNFINSEENDIEKYLLDNKIKEDNSLKEINSEEENEELEDSLTPLEEVSYLEEDKEENQKIEKELNLEKNNSSENELEKNNKIIENNNKINPDNNKIKSNNTIIINNKEKKIDNIHNNKDGNKSENNSLNNFIIIDKNEYKLNNNKDIIKIQNKQDNKNENKNTIKINNDDKNKNTIDYKNTKTFLIEKTENLIFSKEKDKLELIQYSNNNISEENKIENENKTNKLLYEITEFYNKNKLQKEFTTIKLNCLFCYENQIYIGDGEGNLLIYDLKEEKLIKELKNPFPLENKKKLCIKSIYSDEQYIIVGYEKGKLVIYLKNDKNISKTKLFESISDISKDDIIEAKIYQKKYNILIIYCADYKENIFRIKIIRNKIFKNKIICIQITGGLINAKKLEPYYHIEINPLYYKCIGVVNNNAVNIYIIKKWKKNRIYNYDNENEKFFLSFCFSLEKEGNNKFYVSNSNAIKIFEINKDYTAVGQLNTIMLKENIIKIGYFNQNLLYTYTQNNNIKLINFNNNNKENEFLDSIIIDNNDIDKNNKGNSDIAIEIKNNLAIRNGKMFLFYKSTVYYLKTISYSESLNKLNNSILTTNNYKIYDLLFKILVEIYKNVNPFWKNVSPKQFNELSINYANSYVTWLIVQLGNKKSKEEFIEIKNKFMKLIRFLFEVNLNDFILNEKNSLYSILYDNKLNNLYFFLLEPFIIDGTIMNKTKINNSFLKKLINSYLNEENEYVNLSKSWLNEIILHFPLNNILGIEKIIIEKYLLNVIIYLIINYNIYEFKNSYIDFKTPINIIMQLLLEKLPTIDLNNEQFFLKENRYKDEIMFSNDYLRLKLIWYINYIIKKKILVENGNPMENKFKSSFIKEILNILFEEKNFDQIVFNELDGVKQNDKSYILILEIFEIFQLILDNAQSLSKYEEINKNKIFQQIKILLEKRKEFQVNLRIFMTENISKENITDIANDEKLNLVLFFMENYYENCDKFKEIKETKFENDLIEILKSIDSFTFDDTKKLMENLDKCKDNYKKLGEYINNNFKKN